MSDCSGIKTYIKPEKVGISQYIDMPEMTDEERFAEFVRTVELAIDSLEREKYSIKIFADIIDCACNKISDIFPKKIYGDCVVTSDYIVLPIKEKEAYEIFVKKIKSCHNSYLDGNRDEEGFYNGVMIACEVLNDSIDKKPKVMRR